MQDLKMYITNEIKRDGILLLAMAKHDMIFSVHPQLKKGKEKWDEVEISRGQFYENYIPVQAE